MSVNQLPSGVWFYRFHLGKSQFREQGFKTQAEALNAEATKRAEALRRASMGESGNNDLRLSEAADVFMEEHAAPYRKNLKAYHAMIRSMKTFFGNKRIRDISPRDVEAWRRYVIKTGRGIKQPQISLHSVNHYHAALKAIINWVKKKRLYFGENPAWGIDMYKVPKARVRFLTPDEERRLTPVVAKHARLWPYYVIAIHTGMRLGEVSATRVKDVVRHPQPMIFIPNSKSSRSRYVPLHGLVLDVVAQRLRQTDPEARLLDSVNKTTVSLWFNDACREAQVPEFSFHCLRHTFASHMLSQGVPIYKVSKILGHSTTRVTEEHYGHLDRTELAREIHHIEGVLKVPGVPTGDPSPVVNQAGSP